MTEPRWVPHQECWYVPPRAKIEPGDIIPLLDIEGDAAEFEVVIDSVNADGSAVGHLKSPTE